MGMSWRDADEWDYVAYVAALKEWNKRDKSDSDGEPVEAPDDAWMWRMQSMLHEEGYKVN